MRLCVCVVYVRAFRLSSHSLSFSLSVSLSHVFYTHLPLSLSLSFSLSHTHTHTHFHIIELSLITLRAFPHEIGGRRINIIEQAAVHFKHIGIYLLDDRNGAIVGGIEKAAHFQTVDAMEKVFERWLKTRTDCSWTKLVEALRFSELNVLARDIETALNLGHAVRH